MNNRGFSLVELLAVIAILSIILLIFTPNIARLVDDFREKKRTDMLKNNAISAAKQYVIDGEADTSEINCYSDPKQNTVVVDIKELIINKYLEPEKQVEPEKQDFYENKSIIITYDCDNKKFINYEFIE